jgi:hypothetical protein
MTTIIHETTGRGYVNFMLEEVEQVPPKVMSLTDLAGFFPDMKTFLLGAGVEADRHDTVADHGSSKRLMRTYRKEFEDAYKAFGPKVNSLCDHNREFLEMIRIATSGMREKTFDRVSANWFYDMDIPQQKAFVLMFFAVFSKKYNVGIHIDFEHPQDEEGERCVVGVRKANGPLRSLPFKV